MQFIVFQDMGLPARLSPQDVRDAFQAVVSGQGLEYRCKDWRGHYELEGVRRRVLGPFSYSSTIVSASVQTGESVSLIYVDGSPEEEARFTDLLKKYLKELNGTLLQPSPQ